MSPINLQQLFYYLYYAPLVGALVCLLLTYKNIAFLTSVICFSSALLILLCLLPAFFASNHIEILDKINYLGNLNALNILILLIITAIYLVILLFYRKTLIKNLAEKQHPYFYALILVNFFNIIGIITTHHLFKLYLFIEVYSLGCLAIVSFDKSKQIRCFNFHNYCFNVASSVLLLFAFLLMFVIFDDVNIVNYWQNLHFSHKPWLGNLFFLIFLVVIIMKFLPFWQYFYKIKTKSWLSKIFLAEGVFVKSLLAIFLSHKIINNVFGFNLENYWFGQAFIILGSLLIFYSVFCITKTQHFKLISLLLSLATVGFLIILLGLNQYHLNYNSFVFWLSHLFFINFLSFLLSDLLHTKHSHTKIWQLSQIKNNLFLKTIFFFLIIQLTFLPITFHFLASWFLLTENMQTQFLWLLVLSLAVYSLAQIVFANKLLQKII